jgi:hypothetical protein
MHTPAVQDVRRRADKVFSYIGAKEPLAKHDIHRYPVQHAGSMLDNSVREFQKQKREQPPVSAARA